ncbi:lysylphosphatidylglycerol synthase transmembrane domain-containing protein [Natrialbaceae archaeon A-CW3]
MKRRFVLGVGVAAALLALLVSLVGSDTVFAELADVDRPLLAAGLLSGVLALTFRGLVWVQLLTLVDDSLRRRQVGMLFLTAMFIKYVTPYGQVATEPLVAYLVAREGELAYEDGLASVLAADVLNYLPYYSFGFLGVASIVAGDTIATAFVSRLVVFGLAFVVVIAAMTVVLWRRTVVYWFVIGAVTTLHRTTGRVTDRFDPLLCPDAVRGRLDGFYETIDTIGASRRTLAAATVSAHLGMAFLMLPVYIGASALGYHLSLGVVAIAVAVGKLGSVVPAPGGTGGVEAIVTASLATLGQLEVAAALSIALLYRLCTYWLTVGVGGVSAFSVLVRN